MTRKKTAHESEDRVLTEKEQAEGEAFVASAGSRRESESDDEIRMWAKDLQLVDPIANPEIADAMLAGPADRLGTVRQHIESALALLADEKGDEFANARTKLDEAAEWTRRGSLRKR